MREKQSKAGYLLILLLLVSASVFIACEKSAPLRGKEPEKPASLRREQPQKAVSKPRPNILLVSLDTLRADRLHCYGNPRRTSPNMDQLAKEGVLFEQAFASSPWTLPSHLSLFTSMSPGKFFTGVTKFTTSGKTFDYPVGFSLTQDDVTLAQVLRRRGYDTRALHGGGFVDKRYGFAQGFLSYDEAGEETVFSRAADLIRGRVEKGKKKPWFLFVHTYLPHRPYRYEFIFGSYVARPNSLKGLNFHHETLDGKRFSPLDTKAPLYAWKPSNTEIDYFKTVYDGSVRQADMLLGMLLETLRDVGLYDKTLIVVLSDHGEEFWDHHPERSPEHNHSLFDELLRVPLLIRFPGREHAGKRIAKSVRLLDVMPTILEVASVDEDGLALEGKSVLPLILDRGAGRELYAGYTFMGPMRYGVRTDRYKYIFAPSRDGFFPNFHVPREALFDVKADPAEKKNIAGERPEVLERMHDRLRSYRDGDIPYRYVLDQSEMGRRNTEALEKLGLQQYAQRIRRRGVKKTPEIPMDPVHAERLRALGYIK